MNVAGQAVEGLAALTGLTTTAEPTAPTELTTTVGPTVPNYTRSGDGGARGRYDADEIGRIKQANHLADVVARYGTELRPSGGVLVGLCPFHDDREPSLMVDTRDDHYHCFSGACGARGDVIDFVMRRERISFPEACARLGGTGVLAPRGERAAAAAPRDAAGGVARPVGAGRAVRERRWDRLTLEEQVVLNTAAAVYRYCLWREPRALAYLREERGLPDDVIRECGLGYADGATLEAYLRRRSGLRTAQELGLLRRPSHADRSHGGDSDERGERGERDDEDDARRIADESHLRERFAGRIVVPEIRGGNVVWMIGRALDGGESGDRETARRAESWARPKYVALPGERPVLGLERATRRREVLICEGVFDYLTAVAWRLPACSPCGTHLPADRLGFLARARRVFGVFDGDAAGRAAAGRFAAELGGRWREIRLPDGLDLNDLGRRPGGAARFFALLGGARRLVGRREPVAAELVGSPGGPDRPDCSDGLGAGGAGDYVQEEHHAARV